MIVLAACTALLGVSPSSHPAGQGTTSELTAVTLVSDRLDALAGVPVVFENDTSERVVITGESGQSSWADFDGMDGFTLTLGEIDRLDGVTVGMVEVVAPFQNPGLYDVDLVYVERTQPLATPLLLEGKVDEDALYWPPDGDYPHWVFGLAAGSPLRAPMNVGMLMDQEALAQHVAYRGHALPRSDYFRAVTCRTTSAVDLGDTAVLFGLAVHGDAAAPVCIDALVFGEDGERKSLEVTTIFMAGDYIHAEIQGVLPEGWIVLAARPGSMGSSQVHHYVDDPPVIDIPPTAGAEPHVDGGSRSGPEDLGVGVATSALAMPGCPCPMTGATPFVTDCEPAVPQTPNWTCTAKAPEANHCGASLPFLPPFCKKVSSRSPRICRSPGAQFSARSATTAGWKVSFGMEAEVPAGVTKLKTGGGFEYGRQSQRVETDSWTAQAGAFGLGQCMRWYRFELTCMQMFIQLINGYRRTGNEWQHTICQIPRRMWGICFDTSVSQSTCDRTP